MNTHLSLPDATTAVALLAFALMAIESFTQGPAPKPKSLDILGFFSNTEVWSKAPDAFVIENRPYGFQFLDAERTTAFSPEKGRMAFGRFSVYETRVYWTGSSIRRVEVSIFNKGDANMPVTKEKFESSVRDISDFLSKSFGQPEHDPDSRPAPRKVVKRLSWKRKAPLLQLEWAYVEPHSDKASGFRIPYAPEYIRVVLVPRTGHAATDNASLTGKSILRYFGLDVDQHQVAQLADEILYSDSWGPNHALKRMPDTQAWAMTKGLLVLKPRL